MYILIIDDLLRHLVHSLYDKSKFLETTIVLVVQKVAIHVLSHGAMGFFFHDIKHRFSKGIHAVNYHLFENSSSS